MTDTDKSEDDHTRVHLVTIGHDRTNIGPFVRLSFGIVGPPLLFLTHRLELREWRKNLWQAKKLPKQVAKVHCRVAFVCRPCRSWDHRKDILSSRVMFLFKSCIHRRNRPSIIMRTYHEHNKKLPDCVKKSTRLRESTSRPPLIHRVFCAAWLQPEQNRTRIVLGWNSYHLNLWAFYLISCWGSHISSIRHFWENLKKTRHYDVAVHLSVSQKAKGNTNIWQK